MPSFGPPPIEIGMGSNAANARRPARNPPICACHAIACSTPAMLIELQWPPPEAQGRVIGPERPTRLPAEAVEREGREPTLGPPGHVQVGYCRCVPCSASYPTAYACLNGGTSIRPLVLTTADCASAIARSAHVTTRAMSMIAPTNLRRRTGIFAGTGAQLYGPRRSCPDSEVRVVFGFEVPMRTRCKLMGTSNPPH